jgi:hypothetical protein
METPVIAVMGKGKSGPLTDFMASKITSNDTPGDGSKIGLN